MRNLNFFLVGLLLVVVVATCDTAEAGGDDIIQSNDMNNQTAGNVDASSEAIFGGNKSRAYSFGGGDVDINECLYSWSFLVQGVKLNRWCAAEKMDAIGLHEGAAKMRCTINPVRKLYDSEALCIKGQTATKEVHVEPPPPIIDRDDEDHDDAAHDALEARLAAVEAQARQDAKNAQRAAHAARQAAEMAEQAERERKQYAQQALEALEEYQK